MKILKLLIVVYITQIQNFSMFGQKTKVHFFNNNERIYIEQSPNVFIKLRKYTLVETEQDSLYFSNEGYPISIGIEKGKNYYFLFDHYFRVVEVTEREFFMNLLISRRRVGKTPNEVYTF
jgi:hypothetical protein